MAMGRDSNATRVGVEAKGAEARDVEVLGAETKGVEVRKAEARGVEASGVETGGAEAVRRTSRRWIMSPRGGNLLCGRKYGLAALCVVLLASMLSLGGGVGASPVLGQSSSGPSARVWAKKLASGNVEFGVAVYAVGSDDATNAAVKNRLFLYERAAANVGSWYTSEAVLLNSGADRTLVAIRARRLASGDLEFSLRVYGHEDQIWKPTERYFSYSSARVGSVLYSSSFALGQHNR